jgi:glycosyltransferase involved in cell wall biosynthesis
VGGDRPRRGEGGGDPDVRTAEPTAACAILGCAPPRFLDLPDGRLHDPGDDAFRAALDDLGPDLVVIPGWVDDLAPLYARAAVVAVPSRFETFGQSALEAMLHGAPVVASRAGALPELVGDGVTGLLVPPGDPEALAAAVAALLGDPARAAARGAAAAARVRERHLWRHALPALLDACAALR